MFLHEKMSVRRPWDGLSPRVGSYLNLPPPPPSKVSNPITAALTARIRTKHRLPPDPDRNWVITRKLSSGPRDRGGVLREQLKRKLNTIWIPLPQWFFIIANARPQPFGRVSGRLRGPGQWSKSGPEIQPIHAPKSPGTSAERLWLETGY
jgi:hypothetical protein